MNNIGKCPHCGEPIWIDPHQIYCMHCGQPVGMLNRKGNLQEYNPRKNQKSVAIVLVVAYSIAIILRLFGKYIFDGIDFDVFLPLVSMGICIITGACFLWLSHYAVNQAAKIFAYVAGGINLLNPVLQTIMYVMGVDSFDDLLLYWGWIPGIIWAYICSLLLNNVELHSESRRWINLIAVLQFIVVFKTIFYAWLPNLGADMVPTRVQDTMDIFNSVIYKIFEIFIMALFVCSYYKLICSNAFAGNYSEDVSVNYSPLNRWMVALIIAPLMTLVFFVMLKNLYHEIL